MKIMKYLFLDDERVPYSEDKNVLTAYYYDKFDKFKNEDLNLIKESDLYKLEDINSLPFGIDFSIPVSKVECGDSVFALLTCEGEVFTWGNN